MQACAKKKKHYFLDPEKSFFFAKHDFIPQGVIPQKRGSHKGELQPFSSSHKRSAIQSDFTKGSFHFIPQGACENTFFKAYFFFFCRAGLVWWVGLGTEKEELQHVISESHKGSVKHIKGPDNPISQLLPIMSNKSWSGTGKEGKTKEVVEDREVKQVVCEELCVIKIGYSDAQLNDASASTGDQSHQSQPSAISGHACHAKRRLLWASATPAMPKWRWMSLRRSKVEWINHDAIWKLVGTGKIRETVVNQTLHSHACPMPPGSERYLAPFHAGKRLTT